MNVSHQTVSRPSITSSESFAARAQQSEFTRLMIWTILLGAILLATLIRRVIDAKVMSIDRLFFPYLGILLAAIAAQVAQIIEVRRANGTGAILPGWKWRLSAVFDVAVTGAMLAVAVFNSPRGALAALTSPPLLLMPVVILLSVLRLRPDFTLRTGLTCTVIHFILAIVALTGSGAEPGDYAVFLTYSFVLLLTAVAGTFVAHSVRRHVQQAADEASAHERSQSQLASIQRDLDVARDIQRGLLPTKPPALEGFEIAGMNRPADKTGGDYYDWQPLPNGKLAVVLADVAGHGIGPALVMAVCRAYARAAAPMVPEPDALLSRINDLISDDLPSNRFITFALAVLDREGRVQLSSAGHGPTLLYRAATREVVSFGGDGVPLGVIPGEQYGPYTAITLDENDVILMLTDGFFEWSRPGDGQAFGTARLGDAFRAAASKNAADMLHSIDETVCAFCRGAPQSDDMTAVVIKRTGQRTDNRATTSFAKTNG